ncbi:transmembrane protein 255B isoform X10 [Balaenoptera ricei]|uniref:transmembrane protein 255B isoform X10 n=1 Tax=Balaenoptera ricei TaxID=2746895 RepID=UPI0028BE3009|nr:transmembrane protein 255B isoform X10 [Balaenoptera ricei]
MPSFSWRVSTSNNWGLLTRGEGDGRAEGFARRKKTSLWFVGSLLVVSTSILTVGLAATTRTENVTMGGYYPGIIEPRPLTAGRCQFYSSGVGYLHDVYQTEVTCHSLNGRCQLKVKSNTCYCCDLYDCQSAEHPPTYYEFVGVRGCQDVLHLYRLLWASAALNVLGLFLGIVTAAVLGAFKDMVPLSQLAYGPSSAPQVLYNPAQQILAYTGFCPVPPAVPTCSSYPLPLQSRPAAACVLCTVSRPPTVSLRGESRGAWSVLRDTPCGPPLAEQVPLRCSLSAERPLEGGTSVAQ